MRRPRRTRGSPPAPRCPRCGYDLSGAAKAMGLVWPIDTDPSPSGGGPRALPSPDPAAAATVTCSECGLQTPWIDVLDPARKDIPWFYEHTPRRSLGLTRAWRTLVRSLIPWRFWRTVGLSAKISVPRLLLYLPALIVPLHLLWGAANFARRWQFVRMTGAGTGRAGSSWAVYFLAGAFTHPIAEFGPDGRGGWLVMAPSISYTFVAPLAAGVLMPVLLLILSRTRATSRIRRAHILRAGIYGLAWLPCWYLLWTLVSMARAVEEYASTRPMSGQAGRWFFGLSFGAAAPAAVGLCMLWFAAWWWCVVAIGFRLPRAGLVWAVLMTACVLLAVLAALSDQDFAFWLGAKLI